MAKQGADTAKPKRALKKGALKAAIDAHADAPSPLSARPTVLARVQSIFEGPGLARNMTGAQIDAAVLHLWDVGACWGAWPAWAEARFASLIEWGYFNEVSGTATSVAGETTLSTVGMETICAHAGRAISDAAPRKCTCAICASLSIANFAVVVTPNPPPIPEGPGASDYRAFLEAKIKMAAIEGFEVEPDAINPALAPHARAIVKWALRGGSRAIFANFGLFKSSIQIELMRLIAIEVGKPTLIVLPLGVRQEFTREAELRFTGKHAVRLKFIRTNAEFHADAEERAKAAAPTIYLTNYESVREGKIDPAIFVAASLDEAAVLRSYGSKTYQEFLPLFAEVRYRFVATATPSPNRLKELIHYSAFLGVMDSGQALTRFFQRNPEKANDLTLYAHKVEEFWMWVHSWAVFLQRPSDLGAEFSDDGFVLPALDVRWHEMASDHSTAGEERDGQKLLFKDAALGLQAAAAEKRDSLDARVAKVVDIVRSKRISPSLPSGQQGEGARAEQGLVREQQSERPPARETVGGSEPGSDARVAGGACGEEPADDDGAQREVVSGQQDESGGAGEEAEARELRTDGRNVRADARRAKRQVRDLPNEQADEGPGRQSLRGSLPRDPEGEGPALPAVQRRAGRVQGRSRPDHAGSGLSDQIVVWCHLNDEQDAIEAALDREGVSVTSLTGTQDIDDREALVSEWKDRDTSVFLTKPTMYGAGVNLQQSHTMIFAGVNYSFHDVFQAIHRIQRYGQLNACTVHIIHTEAEREIVADLKRKWALHEEMQARMGEIIRAYGLDHSAMSDRLKRSLGVNRREAKGERFTIALNDCVAETRSMDANSVSLIVSSIPFGHQYEYVEAYEDFGHVDTMEEFWGQMDFLTPELLRVLKPGRRCEIHVKDRIMFGAVTGKGAPTVYAFSDETRAHFERHGFDFMGRRVVVTDVVRENNQTYRLGWSENAKDGTKMGCGMAEYVMSFRKPQSDRSKGYADDPVEKPKEDYSRARWQIDAHGFWRSSGNRLIGAEELAALGPDKLAKAFTLWTLTEVYDYAAHVAIGEALEARGALPATFMAIAPGSHHPAVWHDINRMLTLNSEQSRRRVEQHVCPLQLDVIERLIIMYSDSGELVFDPFMGLGTVPYCAVRKGRRGAGSELNPDSFRDAAFYCASAEREATTPTLFALLEADPPEATAAPDAEEAA